MSERLPAPGAVLDRTSDLAERTTGTAAGSDAVNVHVAPVDGGFDPATVDLDDDGYAGENAGDLGRLAAAVDAVEAVGSDAARLHHPEVGDDAGGPWLVVEPLCGRLSTVHAGRGRLVVDLTDLPHGVDAGLCALRDALSDLLEAVRPKHEHYPVERDVEGVFTRGMTTLSLADLDAGGERHGNGPTVRFDVSTTPDTRSGAVESLVSDLACVREATYEPVADLVRSEPPSSLRDAAEAATERVLGDWEYEWYPEPTVFSRLPTDAKLALGTGVRGEGSFDERQYEDCRALLRGTLERYEGA
jgi:hypothetical protein